ncbi:hypothetical protein C8P64_1903 [Christiangramia gaetbulicola]|uniref:Protein-glutamine gamma-glutamyltransferase-like C-terminal domain-containing protein n=1 Tax=Christiangramia gaetbulicola TaxID=703340 RepID=A0A2T6AHV1_9FLAO|nr:DUF4129 domain-containing protein [Christiangramia gaetbulicola]PTX43376.1 hypothetical protein C8P64_1903 [Christiangramia gaetbulicola]
MKNRILVILLFLFFGNIYPQQKDSIAEKKEIKYDRTEGLVPLEFDEDKISEFKTQEDFDYIDEVENESWWSRFKKWINAKYNQFISWLFGDYEPNSILAFFITILPWLLLLILLGLVIWLFSRLNPGGKILQKPKQSEVFLTEEEELVKSQDLPALITEAINNKQFRLAVRYYYLNELRKLDELKLIDYEYQKTNKDYSEEIKDAKIRDHFSEITKLYEFIWYGSFQVSETDFKLVEKGFSRMEQALKSVSYE